MFIDHRLEGLIRREVGDKNLRLAWLPNEAREEHNTVEVASSLAEASVVRRGCYAVMERMPKLVRLEYQGYPICFYRQEWQPVFVLNGRGGTPLRPGRWLIGILQRADKKRRGHERARELNIMRQQAAANARRIRHRQIQDTVRGNHVGFRLWKKAADEMGVAQPSREEMIAMEREAIMLGQREEDDFQEEQKSLDYGIGKGIG